MPALPTVRRRARAVSLHSKVRHETSRLRAVLANGPVSGKVLRRRASVGRVGRRAVGSGPGAPLGAMRAKPHAVGRHAGRIQASMKCAPITIAH